MKTLYLHIGHSKTGTSFVQSCLANSVQALATAGIEYYRGGEGTAQDWEISSGNGNVLINESIESFSFTQDKVLFSSEQLFLFLATKPEFCTKLQQFCTSHGFTAVRMLLFLRDPLPHAESSYQQMVKRGGETARPSAGFAKYKNPQWVEKLLGNPPDLPDLTIEVLNYDNHKHRLIPVVAGFLGVPDGTILEVPDRMVNRSMTEAELSIQRAVNKQMGPTGGFLSDALCNRAPDITAERAYPPRPAQQKMLDRLAAPISAVNAIVPKAERYQTDLQTPARQSDTLQFSREQIDVIGTAVGEQIATLQIDLYLTRFQLLCATAEIRISQDDLADARILLLRAQDQLAVLVQRKHDKTATASMQRHLDRLKNQAG